MYNIVLIDDESWILADVRKAVDWESLGFRIVAEASSGTEGEMLIKLHKPDLIVSDIRMPGLDGLELYRRMSDKQKSESVTVLISAYDEFEYAREALKLGVFDYILKPIKKQELAETLGRVKTALAEMRIRNRIGAEYGRSQTLIDIVENKYEPSKIQRQLTSLGLKVNEVCCRVIVMKFGDYAELEAEELDRYAKERCRSLPDVSIVIVRLGSRKWACVANLIGDPDGSRQRALFRRLYRDFRRWAKKHSVQVGISLRQQSLGQLREAFRQAELLVDHRFVKGSGGIGFYRKQAGEWFDPELKRVLAADSTQLVGIVDALRRPHRHMNLEGITQLYQAILLRVSQLRGQGDDSVRFHEQDPHYAYHDLPTMLDALQSYIGEKEEGSPKITSGNVIIRDIVEQIETHYDRKLMIGSFAEQYHLNASYLSYLFKQETGESFTSRLVGVRMDKAAELLREGRLTLHEISERVGYDDYFHFSKLFKKHKNITPAAYRKQ